MAFLRHLLAQIHPLVRQVPPELRGAVLDRVYHAPEHGFVYFRIPKSANSTVMLTLAEAMQTKAGSDGRGAAAKREGKSDLKLALASRRRLASCFSFTFVRDPYSRTLSAYLDKIVSENPKFREALGLARGPIAYVDFLRWLEAGHATANIHWAPQSLLIPCAPADLDFIGRVETLDADLATVIGRIFGLYEQAPVSRTTGVTGASRKLAEYYGSEEKRLVRKLYARDFALFYPDAD